jgi:hypothetical protein
MSLANVAIEYRMIVRVTKFLSESLAPDAVSIKFQQERTKAFRKRRNF